jgi:predicted extracellular nuclease
MNNKKAQITLLASGLLTLALVLSLTPMAGSPVRAQAPAELFISEYVEGSSYNKALEIYNGTGAAVDLSTYTIELYSNGASSPSQTTALSGTLADGDVFVIAHPSADAAILAVADATNGSVVNFNGDDAVVLRNGATVADVIGQVGFDPGSYWGSGDVTTVNHTLRRKETIETGDTDGSDPFDPAVEWDSYAVNTFDGLGTHSTGGGPEPGQPLPLVEDFDDCTLAGWEIVSVDADTANTWSCNATYSNIDANGYGDSAPANEWLITPPLNLDAQENDTLTFRSYTNYTDSGVPYPQLQVLYSTDYDGGGDPTGATWTALGGITFSPENSGEWTDSGDVDLSGVSGTNAYIAFWYVSSGTGGGSAANWRLDAINIFEQVLVGDWVLNEIHADPASDLSGDANGDGTRHSGQDEFVEIFNNSGADVDVGGWTLSDGYGVRHTFPAGTVVPASCAIVVFGGGTPTGAFGGSVIQTASTGALGLNNGGDSVTLFDGSGDVAAYSYGGEGGDNQSLTRDPDITGPEPLVKHTTATGSGGALFSPGTMVDGSKFAGCVLVNLIHDIQGSGPASPLEGSAVTIEGIVVGDFQNNAQLDNGDLRGFYVQEEDADADADPLTSEGVFVYDGYSPGTDVMVGDFVRVKGQVAEYNGVTEITSLTEVTVLSSDNDLPTPATVSLPLSALTDMEAYEGMSVTFPQSLYISEYYNFDRYGEIVLTSARQDQPTAVVEPGPDAVALAAENLLDRIILDDGRTSSNPDPAIHPNGDIFNLDNLFRGGDTVQNVTGVVDYYYGYKIQPTIGADYVSANPRTAQPDDVGGNLKVASFNVLNYFTTIDTGDWICGPSGDMECRGADTPDEFTRQRDKIIAALTAIDADVVGLIEIENHPEDVPTADLVAGLNAVMGDGTYDYIATGAIGTDAIRQAIIYKSATVTPLGDYAILDSTVDGRFLDDYNRPVPAQTFMDNATGGIFTVAVNHLKSKSSDCDAIGDPDTGDGSGNCNLTRKAAAEALVDWLAGDPTGSGDGDFLIIGDLNSYDKEDPIDVLLAGGYTDLVSLYQGEYAYSYVYDGQVGYLDHALVNSDLLAEVTGTTVWHINADEPDLIDYDMTFKEDAQDALYAPDAYRSSDHDPVIIGLDVCDEIAPTFDEVSVTPDMLWPPNHKYVDVEATVVVSDNFDPEPTVTLVSVESNEADFGLDDEDLPNDIVIVDDDTFQLRAERWDEGDGRVYTITYQVTDACGNTSMATVTVTVPHDWRPEK